MKLKRILSLILVAAIMLSVFPSGVIPARSLPVEGENTGSVYSSEYTWNFDQTVTLGATKGLVSGNAAGTIKVMNHEGNNSLTPNRAIANGILTTDVAKTWGGAVGHGVFYQLPEALTAGKIYQLSLNLYGGNAAAAMNGLTVSFGDYTSTFTGAGGTIQQWQDSKLLEIHNAAAKITRSISGNLSTAADNIVAVEFVATEAMAAGGWMFVTFPMAVGGSYKLGSVAVKEQSLKDGYTWKFDKTVNAFTGAAEFKTLYYGNEANTVGIISHEGYGANWGSNTSRSLKNGILTSVITADWGEAAHGVYYKLPSGLTAGQKYVVSMNLYASAEGTPMLNDLSNYIKLSFVNAPNTTQEWATANMEGYHNADTLVSHYGPGYLSTDTANQVAVTFVATEAMAASGWMLITFPMEDAKPVNLGEVTIKKYDSDNYFLNGELSDGLTGWMTNYDPSYVSAENSVLNVSDKVPTGDVKLYQAMYLEAGSYRLSFDVLGAPTSWRPVYFLGTAVDDSSITGEQLRVDKESGITAEGWWTVTRDVTIETAGMYYFQMNLNQVDGGASVAPDMQYDNFKLQKGFAVSKELSKATLESNIALVVKGQSYENTVTALPGYKITKVTVTMGGEEVLDAYNAATGKISVSAVTGALNVKVETAIAPENDGNLLLNGSFALGMEGWSANASASPLLQIAGGELKFTPGTPGGDARFSQQLTLEPGKYVMSFDSKGQPGTHRPVFYMSKENTWTAVNGQHVLNDRITDPTAWTRITQSVTIEEAGTYHFVLCVAGSNASINPSAEMSFDNFAVHKGFAVTANLSNATLGSNIDAVAQGKSYENTVAPVSGYRITKVTVTMGGEEVLDAYNAATGKISVSAVTGALNVKVETAIAPENDGNLLLNGSFALGMDGWSANASASPLLQIANGELKLTPGTSEGDARFSQELTLEPGKYVISFDSKGQPGTYRPVFYMSKENTWTAIGGAQHKLSDRVTDPTAWTHIEEAVTITEAGTYHFVLCVAASTESFNPSAEMFFDNFAVHKAFDASVVNSQGAAATGLAPYTLPTAVAGAPFELTLAPETSLHTMTVTCTMGGVNVPVTVNSDDSVTIRIENVTGNIVITADSRKTAYSVTTDSGIQNDNSAAVIPHGGAYTANLSSKDANLKLYSVTCTMGGVPVNVSVVNGKAKINIQSVTGDIVINAVFVNKNIVAQWKFDVTKPLTGNGDWGDVGQTISIAHNGYYDSKNPENNRANGTANVAPGLLNVTTNMSAQAATWADAATVIGYKLPADLELGATYIMSLPIYAGNDHTTMASSRNGSTRSGVELAFTTIRPFNMWNASDESVTRMYAEGAGVLATVAPSIGKLSMESNNVFNISFTVTEQIKQYAVNGNYLALIINHQHVDGHYKIGNATLLKVTDRATVTASVGDSVFDGATIAQKGSAYTAHIVPKAGYKLTSVYYTMGLGRPVTVDIVGGSATIKINNVTGNIRVFAVTEELEPNNLLSNGSFILGNQFWSFDSTQFSIQAAGGSDTLKDPAFIQAQGKPGGILSQAFEVKKQTNYELTFRYKGTVPKDVALWAIASKTNFAWNSVIYKASAQNKTGWTEVKVVFNSGNYKNLYLLFRTVEGSVYGLDNIWIKETKKAATIAPYKRPTLGTRPSDSPYDDYPYICDDEDNLILDGSFEGNRHELENSFAKVEADDNAWDGNNSLHYSTTVSQSDSANMLKNGSFANWDPAQKTIENWEFNNPSMMGKLEFVEIGGRRAVKLNECTSSEIFNLELQQKVYLEAGCTYKFSFDFYGKAHYGPNLAIYGADKANIATTNANTSGTDGVWTTLSHSFTPSASGYYYFAARIHNGNCPQTVQYVSNCSVTLTNKGGDIRADYELKKLETNTNYWLTLFVKAPSTGFDYHNFVTFGLTDPETGDFILMASPDSEGGRPYKVDQQLAPMAYDGKWHIITVPFNTGDAEWLNFTIYGENSEAWFDNIYIFKETDAKHYVSPVTDKEEAVVTNKKPILLGCKDSKNLFDNHDLNDGIAFWGANSHRFGVFGNALNVVDSGSSIYGNAMHYVSGKNPTNTYYIKWIDVTPNTEYTFSAKYAITSKGDGFVGLINGYRLDSKVTENRLFPTVIAQFGFGAENYLENHEWQTIAVSFNSGERNRIGFVVCDAGGEAYIDELRLFKASDGTVLKEVADNFPKKLISVNDSVVIEDDVVTGIPAGTTLKNLLKNFKNSKYIRVFDAEGNEITDKAAKIGTGCVIQLMDGPAIKDAAAVVINGDVTGDAAVNDDDSMAILGHISGKEPLEGVYLQAADIDGDGKVTVSDALRNTKKPTKGTFSVSVVGPNAFAQKEEIEIQLIADSDALKAISGKVTSTDGLTFVKAESELDGWELSVKRDGNDVEFAFGAVGGKAAKTGDVMLTLTYRVGMISTYDEAKLFLTELFASSGKNLLTTNDLTWVRKTPGNGGSETVPEDPVIVAARNRLKELSLAEVAISPEFDPEIKEYTATVPFEIDKVTVTAVAMDEDAVVTIGDTNLEYVGKNTVAIRVVSADGLQRTYKIVITRQMPVDQPTDEPTQPDATKPDTDTETSKIGVILWCVGGVLVAAALTILIIILYKRKKKETK